MDTEWVEWVETAELHGPAFEDVGDPPPRLVLFGAVELSAAMSRLARAIGWRSYVVDPRAQYLRVERFPDADELICAWPEEAFSRLGGIDERTAVAVLTHDPVLDDPALVIALRAPRPVRRRDGLAAQSGPAALAAAGGARSDRGGGGTAIGADRARSRGPDRS